MCFGSSGWLGWPGWWWCNHRSWLNHRPLVLHSSIRWQRGILVAISIGLENRMSIRLMLERTSSLVRESLVPGLGFPRV